MNWKKSGLLLIVLLFSLFLVSCTDDATGKLSLSETLKEVSEIGKLDFLGLEGENAITGFMRVLIVILVFAILFELSKLVGLSRNIGITVALIVAIMSAIFIPGSILVGIGSAYGTIVALIFIGIPALGGGYALYRIPSSNRGLILLKMGIILGLWLILKAIRAHANEILGL